MKSWPSKVSLTLILAASCTGLNSCKLFGGGEYSSQMEVETEVPDSLEHGRASSGPAPSGSRRSSTVSADTSVPADSDLVEIPGLPMDSGSPELASTGLSGGASMTGMPSGGMDDVEIPRPDFGSVSLNTTASRPPAEMISLGPASGSPRMALNSDPASHTYSSVNEEKITAPEPPAELSGPATADLEPAAAPSSSEGPAKPGVPLLLGSARLSDYYQGLHNTVLQKDVVENTAPPPPPEAAPGLDEAPPAAAEDLSVPPPPPADADAALPPPPPTE